MSKRRDDDSRPSASAISQRATVRAVPAAKYKDTSAGTIAPRGLRGPSLLPGQGAPERIVPEEVELAVLRDAETLDGPKVARAAAGKRASPEQRSASPTPVSVEVPRVRSIPPGQGEHVSTPPSPSARSIQSGTLMSIGSVDPRAPTELSLPNPRPMSVSERAAYLGPEAVVDRTQATFVRGLPDPVKKGREIEVTERPGPRSARPGPGSIHPGPGSVQPGPGSARPALGSARPAPGSARPALGSARPAPGSARPPLGSARPAPGSARPGPGSVQPGPGSAQPRPSSAPPLSPTKPGSLPAGPASARPSVKADSVAPPAQNFARAARSYSPVALSPSPTMKPPRPTPTPMRPPRPTPKPPRPDAAPSVPPAASSGLGVPAQFQIHSELDAVPHELQEDAFDLRSVTTQREPLASRKAKAPADWAAPSSPSGPPSGPPSAPPVEGERSVRSNRSSSPAVTILVDRGRASAAPTSERTPPQRTAVPLSWVLGAAAFAAILALIVAFVLRPSAPPQAASPLDGRASAVATSTPEAARHDSAPPSVAPGAKRAATAAASAPRPAKSATRQPSSPAASASASPPSSADPNAKVPQSIY